MRRYLACLFISLRCAIAGAQLPPTPSLAEAPGTPTENLHRFDYHLADVRRADDGWQLMANGQTLKHFPREADARQALKLIHELRLTQHGTVGTPQPLIEYWLSEGQAPRGLVRGLRLTPIDPNSVRAEKARDQWVIMDDRQLHFLFGSQEAEAQRAVAIIRRHGFNHYGLVGLGMPSMMYFLVHQDNRSDAQVVTPNSAGRTAQDGRSQSVLPVGVEQSQVQGQLPKQNAPAVLVPAVQPFTRQLVTPATTAAKGFAPVDRVPFDWRMVQLRRDGNDWKLMSGSQTLANFARNERDAKLALSVMQRYRFTELCSIGKSKPAYTYYLVYGQAPRGLQFGVSSVSFRPESLTVQEHGGSYAIADGNRTLFPFGEQEAAARQLLQVIQQHKFDHWCHVGKVGQGGMTFFVRAR